jgi:predicted metal-dependent HD superfamily phosphohydrolase
MGQTKNKIMTNVPMTSDQRKVFVKMLEAAKDRAGTTYDQQSQDESSASRDVAQVQVEKQNLSALVNKVKSLRTQLTDAEAQLSDREVEIDKNDFICLTWDGKYKLYSSEYQGAVAARKATRAQALRKYDSAIISVVAATTVNEAKEIVEPLLS